MRRRDFLRTSGFFLLTVGTGIGTGPGCGDNADPGGDPPDGGPTSGVFQFAQGVASGDPRPASVVLWTRVAAVDGSTDPIALHVEVATVDTFATTIAERDVMATIDSDHTVRVLVDGLSADTTYFYRFVAGGDVVVGRTRTAPAADSTAPVRLAWLSCQDFESGLYGAYRQLLLDDQARPEADQIQAVVHLGDFIYETIGAAFQTPINAAFEAVEIAGRAAVAFPSGGGEIPDTQGRFANQLDDYRHLYKNVLTDPDLRAARARWPFIQTWDDHEFTNDCWQSQANYKERQSIDEPSQRRKVAANQAWFEYIPTQLTGAIGVDGVEQDAHDFTAATVEDAAYTAPDDSNFVAEPNNVAAVGSLTIYRSLRFGQHVELVVTDLRSYRSDHAIPEEGTTNGALFFDPRNVLPIEMVNTFDAGRTANGGDPPASVFGVVNSRAESPPGTMLGAAQKQWWKDTMKGSDATWKVWANEVPLMRFLIPRASVAILSADRVMDADAWDGYPTERTELMTFLRDEGIGNVVAITGDIHAHFAGLVHDDFDAEVQQPVLAEFISAGVASNSLFSFFEAATRPDVLAPVRALVTYDGTLGGDSPFVENVNMLLLHGTDAAAAAAAAAKDEKTAPDAREIGLAAHQNVNPHLRYADTNAQGYGLITVTGTEVRATLVTIERPITVVGEAGPGIRRTASFVLPKDNLGGLNGPLVTGTPPFPLAV